MTAPVELRVLHVHLPCRDEREFQGRLAPHLGLEGLFVPRYPPLPEGTRLLLRAHWLGGAIGVRGEAVVTAAHAGEPPGMTVKLVRLDPDSAQFPISDQPPAGPDLDRFGPTPDATPPSVPHFARSGPPAPSPWLVPTTPGAAPWEDFDEPERGPGLQTVVDFTPEDFDLPERGVGLQTRVDSTPEEPTRVHAPHAEMLRAAGASLAVAPRQRVQFGRYSLLVPLGEEGVLHSWVASARPDGGLRILKATRGPGADSTALTLQAKAIAALHHHNLAQVIDFGEAEGRSFITFEHLYGRALAAILARLRAVRLVPQVEFAVTLGISVCRALEYLHSPDERAPIAHGAVHDGNVFIGAEGEVRLEGPGLWPLRPVGVPTVEGDLQSLGGLLHDVLTLGEPRPQSGAGRAEARWHFRPSEWNRAIPASTDWAVLRATHADPAARYPSARAFRAQLEEEQRRHAAWSLAAMMGELFGPELDAERAELDALTAS